ncbi:hemerythrin domain-containing protein [Kibdelosporangium lantanae]|uniref:Hemerythrin domain-containing protein n=1 Tax=Kibdelosporangium lantanae TaxID=1497396 RepID=A0ABW3M614_9PSEU
MVHAIFRREFGHAPALVRAVDPGDLHRAEVVGHHVELVEKLLHHHHGTEDKYIWPKLVHRVTEELEPLIHKMESQHGEIDKLHEELVPVLADFRTTADPDARDAVAATLERLLPLLNEHLTLEEERVVPLIAEHITAREWAEMVSDGALDVDPQELPLLFGFAMYEGDPQVVEDTINHMPPEVQPVMAQLATDAYAAHAERVYGTATPPKTN